MPDQLKDKILNLAGSYYSDAVNIRRHLHQHPELSFEEKETSAYVEHQLTKAGIKYSNNIAGYGISALIEGKGKGPVIALRADMDALPINEENHVPYKSTKAGVMHACGHDVHTSCLLGAAFILNDIKEHLNGSIKLIFQPAEEKIPGGASLMIKEGILKNPEVKSIIGQHVMPLIPAGKVGFKAGMYMASTDELYLRVKGKGGHGAMPHLNTDPVFISAQLIVALQQIVSRFMEPGVPAVLSFGKIIANGATNVIPDEVYIEGTFRTMSEKWRKEAHQRMQDLAHQLVQSMGGTLEFEIRKGYPFLKNDEQLCDRMRAAAEELIGKENVEELTIWMAAEDFAYYTQEIPGCFYRLGTRNEAKGITSSVHTSTFNIDESAIQTGMAMMSWLAVKELEQSA